MPYRASTARITFDFATQSLRDIAKDASYRNRGLRQDIQQMVFRACVFQFSANVESYLRDFFDSWFLRIRTNGLTNASVPVRARHLALADRQQRFFSRYLFDNDEHRLLDSVAGAVPHFGIIDDSAPLLATMGPSTVIGSRSYPSVRNITTVFARLGVDSVFDEFARRTHRNVELALQSFLDTRQAIAHESPPNVTIADVERHCADLKQFVGVMDRVLFSVVIGHGGDAAWPR